MIPNDIKLQKDTRLKRMIATDSGRQERHGYIFTTTLNDLSKSDMMTYVVTSFAHPDERPRTINEKEEEQTGNKYSIYFNDGSAIDVVAEQCGEAYEFYNEKEHEFLKIPFNNIKYILVSDEFPLKKHKCGIVKSIPPKYSSLIKPNRIESVE